MVLKDAYLGHRNILTVRSQLRLGIRCWLKIRRITKGTINWRWSYNNRGRRRSNQNLRFIVDKIRLDLDVRAVVLLFIFCIKTLPRIGTEILNYTSLNNFKTNQKSGKEMDFLATDQLLLPLGPASSAMWFVSVHRGSWPDILKIINEFKN